MENGQLLMEQAMQQIPAGTPLLLHVCCAPCATTALERLGSHFSLVLAYYNPNIMPREEHERRYQALRRLVQLAETAWPLQLEEERYDPASFLQAARGMEGEPEGGARCEACFALRLRKAAEKAADMGITNLATTLTVGPRKDAGVINRVGRAAAAERGLLWLPADFKKKDGYRRSVELSRLYGLYRQHYCGCIYSRPPEEGI